MLAGRTFGTNVFEAVLTAAVGHGRKLENSEIKAALDEMKFEPELTKL